jgi:hypothetical protein
MVTTIPLSMLLCTGAYFKDSISFHWIWLYTVWSTTPGMEDDVATQPQLGRNTPNIRQNQPIELKSLTPPYSSPF